MAHVSVAGFLANDEPQRSESRKQNAGRLRAKPDLLGDCLLVRAGVAASTSKTPFCVLA